MIVKFLEFLKQFRQSFVHMSNENAASVNTMDPRSIISVSVFKNMRHVPSVNVA